MAMLLEVSHAKIQLTASDKFWLDTYPGLNHFNVSKNQLPKFHSSHQKENQKRNKQHIKKQFLKCGIYFA